MPTGTAANTPNGLGSGWTIEIRPDSENTQLQQFYRPNLAITANDPQVKILRESAVESYSCP